MRARVEEGRGGLNSSLIQQSDGVEKEGPPHPIGSRPSAGSKVTSMAAGKPVVWVPTVTGVAPDSFPATYGVDVLQVGEGDPLI